MGLERIGRYEIQRRLGTGGMGSLYLARDPGLERLVAIKLLKDDYQDDHDFRERFTREARSVARLRHPNVVVIHDVGEDDGRPFMAMEYIAGETLTSVLRKKPALPLVRRVNLVEDLCAGLAHAHAAGIVHRDIKPANVMLDADGVLKILDFGIARVNDSGMTRDGMMMGSVNYMSPEQVVGRGVDHRTDIFAAGAVLYEMVALQQAFPGGIDSGVLHTLLDQGPVPLEQVVPDVDPEIARIVQHALTRQPDQRYQDVNVMRRDIARVRRRLLEQGQETGGDVPGDRTLVPSKSPASGVGHRDPDSDRRRKIDPERFASLRRQQVDEHLRFAREALDKGDNDAALQHAERAATIDPENQAAFDLIDRARFATEARAIRQLMGEARRLVADGQIDDASALADEASATLPDLPEAHELREEVRALASELARVRERGQRIDAGLQRARASIDGGGYETALRAVYEVLALDPEQAEARRLEEVAKQRLQAKREHETARRKAYEGLGAGRALAEQGRFDQATAAIHSVVAPSDTVRLAIEDALAAVRALQRQAELDAIVRAARAAFDRGELDGGRAAIDTIPQAERPVAAQQLLLSIDEAVRRRHDLEQKRRLLEDVLQTGAAHTDTGELPKALECLEAAVRTGLEDERIGLLRQRIADLAVAAQERRRQEARDRLAAKKVEAARQLFTNGDGYAAVSLLERDSSSHPLVETALGEIRAGLAEQERRIREEAERRRVEQEAKRRAEAEAKRVEEERQAAERQREQVETILAAASTTPQDEAAIELLTDALTLAPGDHRVHMLIAARSQARDARRAAEAAATAAAEAQRQKAAEERRRREADERRRQEQIDTLVTKARKAKKDETALELLSEALTLAPGDSRLQTLVAERTQAFEKRRDAERRQAEAQREAAAATAERERLAREEKARREQEQRDRAAEQEAQERATREVAATAVVTPVAKRVTERPSVERRAPSIKTGQLAAAAAVIVVSIVAALLLWNLRSDTPPETTVVDNTPAVDVPPLVVQQPPAQPAQSTVAVPSPMPAAGPAGTPGSGVPTTRPAPAPAASTPAPQQVPDVAPVQLSPSPQVGPTVPPPVTVTPLPQPIPAPVTPGPITAPVPAPTPLPPPPPSVDPRVAITQTIRAYEAAWRSLNLDALVRLQQFSPQDLARVRSSMESARQFEIEVTIQNITVDPSGTRATVSASVSRTIVPRTARRTTSNSTDTLTLEKQGNDTWLIVGIVARQR